MSARPVTRLIEVGSAGASQHADADRATRLKDLLAALVDLAAEKLSASAPARRLESTLLTPDQASELLQIPRSTLLELAGRGDLPCLRFGKHVRFDAGELAEAGRRKG